MYISSSELYTMSLVIYARKCLAICFTSQNNKKIKLSYISIISEGESACNDWISNLLFSHKPQQFPFCSTLTVFSTIAKMILNQIASLIL